jgi:hypothetical protein
VLFTERVDKLLQLRVLRLHQTQERRFSVAVLHHDCSHRREVPGALEETPHPVSIQASEMSRGVARLLTPVVLNALPKPTRKHS